jgi:hypothetical protein
MRIPGSIDNRQGRKVMIGTSGQKKRQKNGLVRPDFAKYP